MTRIAIAGHLIDGSEVHEFTLTNELGMTIVVLEYGAVLRRIRVSDDEGHFDNVVLGYQGLDGYLGDHYYLGATIGRYANRIANGEFELDGKLYQLDVNDPPSSVHGGTGGFNTKLWVGVPFATEQSNGVRLRYQSPHGEGGFPGRLNVEVVYELANDENTLRISYRAMTDQKTVVNLTNHAFFNLNGEGNGDILDHQVMIDADAFLPLSSDFIPTGEARAVAGTPMDFRTPHRIGERIHSEYQQLQLTRGYDHNFVLRREGSVLALAARLVAPAKGRVLEIWTTEPAIDFYTGNYFDGTVTGTCGRAYQQYAGLAIETEHFSNSPNIGHFPSTVLTPEATFDSSTELRFSTV